MKNRKGYLFSFTLFFVLMFKTEAQTNAINSKVTLAAEVNAFAIDTLLIGDINNDKKMDTAFIKGPKFINNEEFYGDCKSGNCKITVSFSCDFPSLTFENAVAGVVENIGDIDKDGNSELVVVPSWFIGCWGKLNFYSIKNKKWKFCGTAEGNICDDEKYSSRITKISRNRIKVREQIWDYKVADRVSQTKIILIK